MPTDTDADENAIPHSHSHPVKDTRTDAVADTIIFTHAHAHPDGDTLCHAAKPHTHADGITHSHPHVDACAHSNAFPHHTPVR
jgi:hypothetical protein